MKCEPNLTKFTMPACCIAANCLWPFGKPKNKLANGLKIKKTHGQPQILLKNFKKKIALTVDFFKMF